MAKDARVVCMFKKKAQVLFSTLSRIPFLNLLKLGSCRLHLGLSSLLWRCVFRSAGNNNAIFIEANTLLKGCKVNIEGNNNAIVIEEGARLRDVEIWIEGDGNEVRIGKGSNLCGQAHLACIEGTSIDVGDGCLFSSGVVLRTGDSHSILDKDSGVRTNLSSSIYIGNHVWIGHHVLICKGVTVPNGCIVGTGAVVTKGFNEADCILAGVPAKVVKRDVIWDERRF